MGMIRKIIIEIETSDCGKYCAKDCPTELADGSGRCRLSGIPLIWDGWHAVRNQQCIDAEPLK
jgi:hypothetical protein